MKNTVKQVACALKGHDWNWIDDGDVPLKIRALAPIIPCTQTSYVQCDRCKMYGIDRSPAVNHWRADEVINS